MLSSQHPQKGAPIIVTLTNVASCNVIKPWALNTLGFISPLDIHVFPAAETQTSELVMCLCCYYLLVLFLFAGNLIMGQASIAVGCSNADWKMSISAKCFQSKQMDEYQARQTMRLCISAWLPEILMYRICPLLLGGRVQRRGWRQLIRHLFKCFSRHEGYSEEAGDPQLGMVHQVSCEGCICWLGKGGIWCPSTRWGLRLWAESLCYQGWDSAP